MTRTVLILLGVTLLGVAAYAGSAALTMRRFIAIGHELALKSTRFERPRADGKPRILVAGDSTAVGTGVRDPAGSIAGRFAKDFPDAEVRNIGINGLKAEGLRKEFPVLREPVDLVVLQIGANDMIQATPVGEFAVSLRAVFKKAKKAGTHVVALHSGNIGLAPLFPWPVSAILRARTLKYRAVYMRVAAEEGVTYVDLFHEKADDPFKGELRFYGADRFHLSEAGYGVWYADVRKAMESAGITP